MKDNIEKIYMGINNFQKNNKYMKLDKIMYLKREVAAKNKRLPLLKLVL